MNTPDFSQPEIDEQFRVLVEAVQDYAIFTLDPDGNFVGWNAGAERIKGYPAEEIIGQHFSCFFTGDEREQGKPQRGLAIAAKEDRWADEGWRVRKDGAKFQANVVIAALRGRSGQLIGFAKVARDLTELQRAEAEHATSHLLLEAVQDYAIFMLPAGNIVGWQHRQLERRGRTHQGLHRR